jgi:hypothetical protein
MKLNWVTYITTNGRYRTEAWKINDLFPGPRGRPLSRPPILTPPQKCVEAVLAAAAHLGSPKT